MVDNESRFVSVMLGRATRYQMWVSYEQILRKFV